MNRDNNAIKTISRPYAMVQKLWKKNYDESVEYRPLSFLVFSECDQGLLILNTVSSEIILISSRDWECPSPEIKRDLVDRHYLVPRDMDDKKYVDQLRVLLSMTMRKKAITKYVILPTSCCNAHCFYCFESEYKHATMSIETAQKTVDFIEQKSSGQNVKINWFGGEPMMGVQTIDYICNELRSRGIQYTSSMISNGYLFTEQLCQKAKNHWNLEKIQITLDGTEEVYNKIKNYKHTDDDRSPFYRVLDNAESLANNGIRVSLRLNMSLYNRDDIKALAGELVDRFKGNKYINMYCMVLFENTGYEPISLDEDANKELYLERAKINEYFSSFGFRTKYENLPVLKFNSCIADSENGVVIGPNGELAKCEQHCMDKLVGDIFSDVTDTDMQNMWKQKVTWTICQTCQLYPYCYKLKNCDSAYECKEYAQEIKISNIKSAIDYKYKCFVEKNTPQDYVESENDFDD